VSETPLLEAARGGDEAAFGTLVEPYRAQLQAHAYRMLGSAADAEDALQETLLNAWRGLPRFEGRSSVRSWLYTIATNVCLRVIERRPKRVLPIDYGPPGDPHEDPLKGAVEAAWVEPYPDEALSLGRAESAPEARYEERESVELAFIAALQYLPPRQRAVLILRDVLGFSAREVAEALEGSPASVDSALQRAHKTVDERLPGQDQQATLRSLGDEDLRKVVDGYVDAWQQDDVDALVAMLAEEATFTMPPIPTWFSGRDAIADFLRARPLSGDERWRLVPTRANGQLAFAHYQWKPDRDRFVAHAIHVLTLEGTRIRDITAFRTPEAFGRFRLPDEIEA
jgi:RNA polymerase sigma-70 factor (ECF subfamily)